ncbi:PstS family phosphate ABC transporter substrate-binding protein [Gloeobacter violaceus]|nr:PstS family phosphate ABC transporter substrate-binding protein [Gloeobacter violaceus]
MMKKSVVVGISVAVLAAASMVLAAQNTTARPSQVSIDGSSTVHPITRTAVEEFLSRNPQIAKGAFAVGFSGTGGGLKKLCTGEIDIAGASRPISRQEIQSCRNNNIAFMELPVAFDALTVVVHPKNTWASEITVAELKKIWERASQGKITRWSQVRPGWPDRPLKLYGPGRDSGTYDYFAEAILGSANTDTRSDYVDSEDDDVLVRGVSEDPDALSYFGYAYYEASRGRLKALAVANGLGAVAPSRQAVEKNLYQPLARPLFLYVNMVSSQTKPPVREFVGFYLQHAGRIVNAVGYVPLPPEGYHIANNHFWRGKRGTVYGGKAQIGLTLRQMLLKTASF